MVRISEYDPWLGIRDFISVPEALVTNTAALGIAHYDLRFLMTVIVLGLTGRARYGVAWPVVMASRKDLGDIMGLVPGTIKEKGDRLERAGVLRRGKPTRTSKTRYDLSPLIRRLASLATERAPRDKWGRRWRGCGPLVEIPVGLVRKAQDLGLRDREFGLMLALVVLPGRSPGWPVKALAAPQVTGAIGLQPYGVWMGVRRLRARGLLKILRRGKHVARYDLSPLVKMLRVVEGSGWGIFGEPEWVARVAENRRRAEARAKRRWHSPATGWLDQQPYYMKRQVRARIV